MKTKIIVVQFDFNEKSDYARMTSVFKKSVHHFMHNVEFVEINLDTPSLDKPEHKKRNERMLKSNTVKLDAWLEQVVQSNDNLVLADADMLANGNIEKAFTDYDFDIALTKRPEGCVLPRNGGIVLVKPTDNARDFMRLWQKVNLDMYNNEAFHKPWRDKAGGMNQAALGYILETGGYRAKVIDLPCQNFNSCDDTWFNINDETIFIHIKGKLRQYVLRNYDYRAMPNHIVKAARMWREMEAK